MLLSIGLIVKNEEKYLEQCLTALQPILNSIDSELIIADTGSTDNTVEIAKKFTDNVYYFEWINDFAAARNFTLERAKGEWYMFIDADEIFQSCNNIINFFKSGEYRKYTFASYTIRNYTNIDDLKNFSDHFGLRLCKKIPEVHFSGKIHETFNTWEINSIIKFIPDVADHFGYLFISNPELKQKKMSRNLELLYDLVENESIEDHPLAYSQISDCLVLLNEKEKALEYIDKGINELRNLSDIGFALIDYYTKKMQLLFKMSDYEKMIEVASEYFSSDNIVRKGVLYSDIELYFLRADAYKNLGEYNKALKDYAECFRLMREEKRGKLDTPDKLLGNRIYTIDKNIVNIVNDFSMICVLTNKFGTLDEHLKILSIEDYYDDHNYIDFRINLQFEIMDHLGYKDLQKWYVKLDDYGKKSFNKFSRHGLFFTNKQSERINAILKLKTDDNSLIDIFRVFKTYLCDNSTDITAICEFGAKYGYEKYPELLYIMLFINADITPFINNSFFSVEYTKQIIGKFPDFIDNYSVYDISAVSPDGIENAAILNKAVIFAALEKKKPVEKLLERFSALGNRWQTEFDNDEIPCVINESIIIGNVLNSFYRKDYKACLTWLRSLIAASKDYAPVVKHYQQLIKDAMAKQSQPSVKPQLAEMSAAVKKNVREMIAAGNYSAADKTLRELAQIVPGDPEIDMLYEEIEKSR